MSSTYSPFNVSNLITIPPAPSDVIVLNSRKVSKGKKLSLQNIFILVLQEEKIRNVLKDLLTIETNFDVVKLFIDFEPSITKSKYITKFLNSHSDINL